MNSLVSIIVPVYNAEKHLKTCVDSLRRQTYQHIEILLLDDESKDGSLALCEGFAAEDERIRLFHHKNVGASETRNRGIDEARGKYIVFCDSDDIMELDAMEQMVNAAAEQNADLVIGAYGRFYNDGEADISTHCISPFSKVIFDGTRELALLYSEARTSLAAVSVWAKLYVTDIIREHGVRFPADIHYEEDCRFNLQYYRHVTCGVALSNLVYHYRQIPTSLSKAYRRDQLPNILGAYKLRCELMEELNIPGQLPKLRGVMLIVFETRCKRLAQSSISKADIRIAYTDLVTDETVQKIVHTTPMPRKGLRRQIIRAIRLRSVPLLSLLMAVWTLRQKIKKA